MAAAGLFTQILGGVKSGQAMDKANTLLNNRVNDFTAWYNTERNRDFLQSNLGSSIMNRIVKGVEDQNKTTESTGAITGASDAATLAAKGATQEAAAEAIGRVAEVGTQREQVLDSQFNAGMNVLTGQQIGMQQQAAANAANLTETGGNLIGAAAPLIGETKWGMKTPDGTKQP